MAAGEDQSQAVVRDFIPVVIGLNGRFNQPGRGIRSNLLLKPCLPAKAIYCFVLRGLDNPRTRIFGHSFDSPLVDGYRKRFLRCILGDFKITEMPNESSNYSTPV